MIGNNVTIKCVVRKQNQNLLLLKKKLKNKALDAETTHK
jgi:hypothetical protein